MMSKLRPFAIVPSAIVVLTIGATLPGRSLTMDQFFKGQWFGQSAPRESNPESLHYCNEHCQVSRQLHSEGAYRTARTAPLTPAQTALLLTHLSYTGNGQSADAIYSRVGSPHWVSKDRAVEYYLLSNEQQFAGLRYNASDRAVGVTVR